MAKMHDPWNGPIHAFFGLSYASWLTLPRSFMQEMPDEWQQKLVDLVQEYLDTFPNQPDMNITVSLKKDGRFVPLPQCFDYHHPDMEAINAMRANPNKGVKG